MLVLAPSGARTSAPARTTARARIVVPPLWRWPALAAFLAAATGSHAPSAPLASIPCDLGRSPSFSAPFAPERSAQRTLWDGKGGWDGNPIGRAEIVATGT